MKHVHMYGEAFINQKVNKKLLLQNVGAREMNYVPTNKLIFQIFKWVNDQEI